jgi:hypothetical protein
MGRVDSSANTDLWGPAAPFVLLALTFLVEVVARPGRRLWSWATRRRRLNTTLRGLACEVQIQTFEHALGQPPTYRWEEADGAAECVFVLEDAYVQAITDPHGSVLRYAITTRSKAFAPVLWMPGVNVEIALGRTTFAEVPGELCAGVSSWLGARRYTYAEAYYFGNPGFYQTWVLASNQAGPTAPGERLGEVLKELGDGHLVSFGPFPSQNERTEDDVPHCWHTRPVVARFRATTPINTLGVSGPHQQPDPNPGPDQDRIRPLTLLPPQKRRRWRRDT